MSTTHATVLLSVSFSSKRAVDESEMEAAERRSLRCVWVSGGRALTEQEAAVEIVSEARLLLKEDLAQLGVQWDPTTLPPGAPAVSTDEADDNKEGDQIKLKTRESNDVDRCRGEECKLEKITARREHPEETEKKLDKTETGVGQTAKCPPAERGHVRKTNETNAAENLAEVRERQNHNDLQKKGCETGEGRVSVKEGDQQSNQFIPERNLTQELDEIVSTSPKLLPQPQPSPSPMPPPRFRAPMSRLEGQNSPKRTSKGDGTTVRALSKVLHSIQTDKRPHDDVDTAQTSCPAAAPVPGPQTPATAPAPANNSPLSSSPALVPLFSPEAKRRRMEHAEVDKFSSPELYIEEERDEEAEGTAKNGEESFGDSFELDTQTERIILQQTNQNGEGNDRDTKQLVEAETTTREEERVETCIDTLEVNNRVEAPDNAGPRLNTSLTESQMELILNTSHQVTHHYHKPAKLKPV